MKLTKIVIFLWLLLAGMMGMAQTSTQGTEFWVSFMSNASIPEIKLIVSANAACTGTVTNPNTGWSTSFSVSDNGLTNVVIPVEQAYATSSETIETKGLKVTTTQPVSLFASNFYDYSFDAANVHPTAILASAYMLQSYPDNFYRSSEFLIVATEDTIHITITDTLCVHNEYHNHGFDLPIHDSAGYFYYTQNYTTATGCDSVRTLILYVIDNPSVTITGDSVICSGENTTLHALGEGATISGGGTPPPVAIGDILCTDNTTIKPNAFAASGKTAKGVVFYVDATGWHGWAVALEFACNGCMWGPYNSYSQYTNSDDVHGIINYTNARQACTDINGMANTLAIQTHYGSNFSNCEAAYSCYYYNHTTGNVGSSHRGWYLPAAGQLRKLYSTIHTLNPSIALVGGTIFPTSFWLWSSSEYSYNYVWYVYNNGLVDGNGKGSSNIYGRAVCAF